MTLEDIQKKYGVKPLEKGYAKAFISSLKKELGQNDAEQVTLEEIKTKYAIDGIEEKLKKGDRYYKVFNGNTVVLEGALNGAAIPRAELVRKAMASGKKWDVISVFQKGKAPRITFIKNPGSEENAKRLFGVPAR